MWDLSCPDWAERLRAGKSLIPDLPLNEREARDGLATFDEFRLPDALALDDDLPPRLGDAAGQWFRDLVRASFGSWDPQTGIRSIRDIFCLAPKGSSKTTYAAGLMLAIMWLNRRRNCQALFVGPTQSVSDRAYEQAVGMIEMSPSAKSRFRTVDHEKAIIDRVLNAEMKVKTFDANVLTGAILIFALVDELHLLGRSAHTTKVMRQIRGGLDKTPEGLLLITTTQSDDRPVGAFKDELVQARKIRDGEFRGKSIRPLLPILYEFPPEIACDQVQWENPENWRMVMPNLGRSVHMRDLAPDWQTEKGKGEHPSRIWASQHLNIEIGVGLGGRWAAADFWEAAVEPSLTFETLLERSEVVVLGVDDGGLDDLLGLTLLGRETGTGAWLSWSHAWVHRKVLEERRQSEATTLRGFAEDGDLVIVDSLMQAAEEVADIVDKLIASGKLPEKNGIGQDQYGPKAIVQAALLRRGIDVLTLIGLVPQHGRLTGAIKDAEVRLADGSFWHAHQPLMDWCMSNARIETHGNSVAITKEIAGTGKIDPVSALLDAVALMSMNPQIGGIKTIYGDGRALRFAA